MTEHIFQNGVEEGKRISLLYQVSLHLEDLHCRCCFILLHMHALEKWAFDRFHHRDALSVHRWVAAGSVFSATRKAARIFYFFFTAVAKQSSLSCLLTCETFVIFTDVPDTILSLFSPFWNAPYSMRKNKKNLVALKKKLKTIQIQSINLQKQSMITIQINSRQILVEGTNRVWDPGLG